MRSAFSGSAVWLALAVIASCTPAVTPSPTPSAPASTAVPQSALPSRVGSTPLPLTFALSASQVSMVGALTAFLSAYNAGQVSAAQFWLTDDVQISDCGYRPVGLITASGKAQALEWLNQRKADHDHLTIDRVENENPDPATGSHVLGVVYARRTSDTLASLGFPSGIVPQGATKVVFNATDDKIRAFANGPGGAGSVQTLAICTPK